MKIFVRARPGSKEEKVQKVDEGHFVVSVKAPPVEGKANQAILELLSDYFKLPKARIRIVSGHTGRQKVIEIV